MFISALYILLQQATLMCKRLLGTCMRPKLETNMRPEISTCTDLIGPGHVRLPSTCTCVRAPQRGKLRSDEMPTWDEWGLAILGWRGSCC
ncbi:hypothetical protein HDV63DRAFT_384437 [Trichoderma sp. SZMC 28014]